MAEHTHSGTAELGAPMDYSQHERTYAGFIAFSKITVLSGIITMIALALYGFGSGGFWLGTILILLMMVAATISIVAKGSIKPLVAVTILGFLMMAVSLG